MVFMCPSVQLVWTVCVWTCGGIGGGRGRGVYVWCACTHTCVCVCGGGGGGAEDRTQLTWKETKYWILFFIWCFKTVVSGFSRQSSSIHGDSCVLWKAHMCSTPSPRRSSPAMPLAATVLAFVWLQTMTFSRRFKAHRRWLNSSVFLRLSPPLMLMMMKWCLMSSDVSWHIRDKLWPMPKHGSV